MTLLLSEDSIAASRACLAAESHGSLSILGFVMVKGLYVWDASCLLPLRPCTSIGCGIGRHAGHCRPLGVYYSHNTVHRRQVSLDGACWGLQSSAVTGEDGCTSDRRHAPAATPACLHSFPGCTLR